MIYITFGVFGHWFSFCETFCVPVWWDKTEVAETVIEHDRFKRRIFDV